MNLHLAIDSSLKTAHAVAHLNAEIIVVVTKWCPVQREGGGGGGQRDTDKLERETLTDRH